MITPEIAVKIARRDPDGDSSRRPTKAAYDDFRAWAIAAYGASSWKDYVAGNVRADDRI